MKLLNEIIEGATASDIGLPVLLRKCLVLASRLKNGTLKEWCGAELDGYSSDDALPEYRIFGANSFGLMVGPLGAQIRNQPIPLGLLSERHRDLIRYIRMPEPIAEIESLAKSGSDELSSPWPADLVAMYAEKIIAGYGLNRAWRSLPVGRVIGICDTVRNRILRLALELQEQVGDSDDPLEKVGAEEVQKQVITYIYGGQNVINSNVGGDLSQANNSGLVAGDFDGLTKALGEAGVHAEQIAALPLALAKDQGDIKKGQFGTALGEWIKGAANTAGKASVDAVAGLLRGYLGI
ncbi:MAG: hypothetical protein J0I42_14940 [Bosea sp.]|uniref:AbiTii domain-containing protein n=1 Tax=Bosea sp. (in: a-proteobacteria) TaxID=1871050 RepID=UPI001AC08AD7|nr:hypothetical protein [Bosea sp. (in: a-proteobacteria)]MBN9453242.1 hypothetical protein [Bosea sp. (in: a-proteobacteria)]